MERQDNGRGNESASVVVDHPVHDAARWLPRFTLEKYTEDIDQYRALAGIIYEDLAEAEAAFFAENAPYETIEGEGNLLLNAGISLLEDLLIGAGGTTYANANARIGVGDSTTAAAATQTDLQAASNKLFVACDATYPSRATQVLTFKTTFATGQANYAWQEWAVDNGATKLNRKVESLGTKVSGSWALTVTITIA